MGNLFDCLDSKNDNYHKKLLSNNYNTKSYSTYTKITQQRQSVLLACENTKIHMTKCNTPPFVFQNMDGTIINPGGVTNF